MCSCSREEALLPVTRHILWNNEDRLRIYFTCGYRWPSFSSPSLLEFPSCLWQTHRHSFLLFLNSSQSAWFKVQTVWCHYRNVNINVDFFFSPTYSCIVGGRLYLQFKIWRTNGSRLLALCRSRVKGQLGTRPNRVPVPCTCFAQHGFFPFSL